ncbi:MAG TPA: type II secretion system F family protein [Afifellaceae bacterium]|nr:type II secretion system F family protein [Afifellaceae bacterium]
MISSSGAQIAMIALGALSLVGVVFAFMYPTGDKRGKRRIELAASGRTAADRSAANDEVRRKKNVESTLKDIEAQQRQKKRGATTLTQRMRQAGLEWTKNTYWVICSVVGVVAVLFNLSVAGMPLPYAAAFGLAAGLLLPYGFVNLKRRKRFKAFSEEFPNGLDVIVRGVKAGLPLVDCMKVIAQEAKEPVCSEFREIIEDQTLGLPMDEAVMRLQARMPISEARFFAIVIAIQSRTGGSLSEALSNLSHVLRERKKMQGKIKAMSAEAKASAGIIGALPVVVAVLVYITTPDYILLLFTTETGNNALFGSAIWMMMGVAVMKKMINFDF